MNDGNLFWLVIGLAGNFIFGSRFIMQWIASERAGRSTVPTGFWYWSIAGTLVLLVYALHLGTVAGWKTAAPLVIGNGANLVPYLRNLALIRRQAA